MLYPKIVLKLSGEALKPSQNLGIEPSKLAHYVAEIAAAYQQGGALALVVGGGNFWRGQEAEVPIRGSASHSLGMLATVMNAIALRDALGEAALPTLLMSRLSLPTLAHPYNPTQACEALEARKIVLIAGGLGAAFFSTDTAALTTALDLQANILVKGTKVGGVYPQYPRTHPGMEPYKELSLEEVYKQQLGVMDLAAIALAQTHHLPIIVYNAQKKGHLARILQGEKIGTRLYA